jgi:hypothetical protein
MNDAYIFYNDYAKLAGFSLRTARTSKETRHWVCFKVGWHESKGKEVPNKRKKDQKGAAALHISKLRRIRSGAVVL